MKKKKQLTWLALGSAAVLVICLLVGIVLNGENRRLEQLRQEKLAQLQLRLGDYNLDSMVLRDTNPAQARKIAELLGARLRITSQGDFAALYLPEGMTPEEVYNNEEVLQYLDELMPDFHVDSAALTAAGQEIVPVAPNYTVEDPQYGLQDYLEHLNLADIWKQYQGRGVTVAVIDTGIDTDHPEFAGRISEYSYNASEDKVVADYGISVIEDEQGHGTAVAGVIGAGMNNGIGIAGIAPETQLLVIKCECTPDGSFLRTSDLVFGLAYAIERDVDIVNMSFGTYDLLNPFEEYTKLAVASDIICVAAAGNDTTSTVCWPAADPNVIGVGALDTDTWELAFYSNFGENSDMIAPGTTYTTSMGGGYSYSTGTSVSSPVVAGALALFLEKYGTYMEFDEVVAHLQASNVDLGGLGEDWSYGFGALDVEALLSNKGTITYDMLTTELPGQTQLFVYGHTVQTMPEPERGSAVFDGWYYDEHCTEECELYTTVFDKDITLYAGWINEDDGAAFTYTVQKDGSAQIQSYTGKRRYVTVPNQIDGHVVTSIGERAFEGNTRIRSVVLPQTLTDISLRAFYGCTNLLNIEIPENVRSIGSEAFYNCGRLRSVGIVATGQLERIEDFAFANTQITGFQVPEKLQHWGTGVLVGSLNVERIQVAEGNTSFRLLENALYDISGETLIYYPAARSGVYTLPAGTIQVGDYAFYGSRVSNAILPEGLQSIGSSGFAMSRVQTVQLPASFVAMGNNAWAGCASLRSVDMSKAEDLTVISEDAFNMCTMLGSVAIPDQIQVLNSGAFSCSGLKTVSFGSGSQLQTIGRIAFAGTPLRSFSLPSSVQTIGAQAFEKCFDLASFEIPANSSLQSIGGGAFSNCLSLKHVTFPAALKALGELAFYGSGLEQVHIPAGLTDIGNGAFASCQSLPAITVDSANSVYIAQDGVLFTKDMKALLAFPAGRGGEYTLPATIGLVAPYGFSGAAELTVVTLNEGLTEIAKNAFEYCTQLTAPVLPESLVTIGEYAFSCCTSLNWMEIPKNVLNIGRFAFYGDYNLWWVRFAPDSTISRLGYGAFAYCGISSFDVPASVTTMGQEVFAGSNLYSIRFLAGSKLENLPAWVFSGTSIDTIYFEDNCALRTIEAQAFDGLHTLSSINLENCKNLEKIGNYAFRNCASLQSIQLPEGVTEIGRFAFYGCTSLGDVRIPKSVEFIGRYAFYGNEQRNLFFAAEVLPAALQENWDGGVAGYYVGVSQVITSGDWTYTLTEDGKASIIGYTGSATQLTIDTVDGYPVVGIGSGAFRGNTQLRKLTLPNSLLGIYKYAFAGTTALESITIPASVEVIDEYAFQNSGIAAVQFAAGSKLTGLGRYAFADTGNLKSITLPAGLEKVRDYVFYRSGLESVQLPAGLKEIGYCAFSQSALKSVALPQQLELVGGYAFAQCRQLTQVTFGTGASLRLDANAFYQSGLSSVSIPANVRYIGEFCFSDCQSLTAIAVAADNAYYAAQDNILYSKDLTRLITCPAGRTGSLRIGSHVTTLAFGAFEGSQLSEIQFPQDSKLSTLGYRTFYRCENLTQITIPDGVHSIDRLAFAYCPKLKTVNIGADSQLGGIYYAAFYQCAALENIAIPDGLQELGAYAFYGCEKLTALPLSEQSQLKVVEEYAFSRAGILEFVMPAQLLEVETGAFQASGLQKLVLNEALTYMGDFAFADCGLEKTTQLHFPADMDYMGLYALRGVTALEEITVPFIGTELNAYRDREEDRPRTETVFASIFNVREGLQGGGPETLHTVRVLNGEIPPRAFDLLTSIKKVYLPDNATVIYEWAFSDTGIEEMTLPEGIETIGEGAFFSTPLRTINLPEGLLSIDSRAFEWSELNAVEIPSSVVSIGENAFNGCKKLKSIQVAPGNAYYASVNGLLLNKEGTAVLTVPSGIVGEVHVPAGIKTVCAVENSDTITRIVLPEGVEQLGTLNFCTALEEINLPDSLLSVGSFTNCTSLKSIHIPDKVEKLPKFEACYSLETVTLGSGITEIPSYAFYNAALKSIELPEGLTKIGELAFQGCQYLRSIHLPESLEVIEANAFTGCGLVEIFIPAGVHTIAGNPFGGCNSLCAVTIAPENPCFVVTDGIIYSADRTALIAATPVAPASVIIPEGVQKIGPSAFANSSDIYKVYIPDTVTEMGAYTFSHCRSIRELRLSENCPVLPEGMLYFAELEHLTIPACVQEIGDRCFELSGLKTLDVQTSQITFVGVFAFRETAISRDPSQWIDGCLYVGNYLVAYDPNMDQDPSSTQVREGTTHITDDAISSQLLKQLWLPDSLQHIGAFGIFAHNLEQIRIGENLKTVMNSFIFGSNVLNSLAIRNTITNVSEHSLYIEQTVRYGLWLSEDCLAEGNYHTLAVQYVPGRALQAKADNLIVFGGISDSIIGMSGAQTVYCEAPRGSYTNDYCTVYYQGEWNLVTFWANDMIVQMDPYLIDQDILAPADSLTQQFARPGYKFAGWDINGDGVADRLPATAIEQINAVALWTFDHNVVTVPGQAPTCYEPGLTEGSVCADCGLVFTYQAEIPAGHDLCYGAFQEETCTEWGTLSVSCSRCDLEYEELIVYPKGHWPDAELGSKEPTCDESGYTTYSCKSCGQEYQDDWIDPLGHIPSEDVEPVVTPPSCVSGYTTYFCERCQEFYQDDWVEGTGQHHYEAEVIEPTCQMYGCTRYTCVNCGDWYEVDYTDPVGCVYVEETVPPTCQSGGYTISTCKWCGSFGGEEWYDPLPCDYVLTEEIPADCQNLSRKVYTCTMCGGTYTEYGETLGDHAYTAAVTPPTCTEQGYTTHTCTVCGHSYEGDYVAATGHSYGPWERVHEPTCTEEGLDRRSCSCGASQTRPVEMIDHSYDAVVTAPTCTEEGYTTYTCTVCHQSYVGDYVGVVDHNYDAVVTAPTCTEEGYTTHTCTVCGHSYVDTPVEALGHLPTNPVVTPPTESAEGYTTYLCNRCGQSYKADFVPALRPAQIESSKFTIQDGYISKITTGTTVEAFLSGLKDGQFCQILGRDGKPVAAGKAIGTGMTVNLLGSDGKAVQSLTIVVTGDTNGDGKTTMTDMLAVKSHLLGKSTLSGAEAKAGDVNGDGKITATDFLKVKAFLLGKGDIQPQAAKAAAPVQQLLPSSQAPQPMPVLTQPSLPQALPERKKALL